MSQNMKVILGISALLNIFAGKYITEELSLFDKKLCSNRLIKKLFIIVPIFLVTSDFYLSLIIGLIFLIINEII
tara:strand:+ start:440 stop:661 length:222 start_codon:yes stop_codon:yes gene_type:complete